MAKHIGLAIASALAAAGIFAWDVLTPLEVAGGIPYVALVLVGLWFPWRKTIFLLALLATVLVIAGYSYRLKAGCIGWLRPIVASL